MVQRAAKPVPDATKSIFDEEWWPEHVAAAWALSRDRELVEVCAARPDPRGWVVQIEAINRRLAGRPVMLFPSVGSAKKRLRATFNAATAFDVVEAACFRRDAVIARFPGIDDRDRVKVLASVWQGNDPNEHERIPLSDAIWWIASQGANDPVVLDDHARWEWTYTTLVECIINDKVAIFATYPGPAERVPSEHFAEMPVKFLLGGVPMRGRHLEAHVLCAVGTEHQWGDQWFGNGGGKAKWQRLMIPSAELMQCAPFRRFAVPTKARPARRVLKLKSVPKAGKRKRIAQKMLADLREKHLTVDDLHRMPESKLIAIYGRGEDAGRTTVREARAAALSCFDGN